jgi:hypothetical protein
MSFPKDEAQKEMMDAWRSFLDGLENSINKLDADIKEAAEMADQCTSEWCTATEHVIDELASSLFSISEPRWAEKEDSERIRALRKRVYDLYANYREVYQKIA